MMSVHAEGPAWVAPPQGSWAAIGNFDGLHEGHAQVARMLLETARAEGARALQVSFRPHPAAVTGTRGAPPRLLSDAQRSEILEAWGLDGLVLLRFDVALSKMSPDDFVNQILIDRLQLSGVIVGRGFRFGRRREGDFDALARLLESRGARALAIEPVEMEGEVVSSSRIRRLIASGDLEAAARLLGRPHVLEGRVVEGHQRGRLIGFPTANLDAPGGATPARGVHACVAGTAERTWRAVANVGLRPTFEPGAETVEVHVLGSPGDLYGQTLRVAFLRKLRDEKRFEGPAALAEQIERDIGVARGILGSLDIAALRGPGF